jgi:iron complex transport system substrate-binding protein
MKQQPATGIGELGTRNRRTPKAERRRRSADRGTRIADREDIGALSQWAVPRDHVMGAIGGLGQPVAPSRSPRSIGAVCVAVAVLVLLAFVGACRSRQGETNAKAAVSGPRVVSLVPAVTEMLFAVGAGPQVVGVSSFDKTPAEVATRPRVGALLDPDVERILSLKPDLVVTYGSQEALHEQLARAGIAAFTYRHGGIGDTLATLEEIGTRTGHGDAGREAAQLLRARLTAVRMRVDGRPRPRVLLIFGREPGSIRNVWASGGKGFLHELLDVAGADNVFADVDRENVQATSELLLARAPEVIVELQTERRAPESPSPWLALPGIPAVKSGGIVTLQGDQFVVPGPRLGAAAEALARALHPDAWSASAGR